MTDRRMPKPTESNTPRSLLKLDGGDRRGLERAFQALVRRPAPPLEIEGGHPGAALVLQALHGLGFISHERGISHPLAPGRVVPFDFEAATAPGDPEGWALEWAARYFAEMEFYLPYIILRAARARPHATGVARVLSPEPEYDDDGFLAESP